MIISSSFLLRMRNVPDKLCRENQNTHFVFNNLFFSENRAFNEIIWTKVVVHDRPQITIKYGFKGCHPRCVGELDRWEGSQKHNSYLI